MEKLKDLGSGEKAGGMKEVHHEISKVFGAGQRLVTSLASIRPGAGRTNRERVRQRVSQQ